MGTQAKVSGVLVGRGSACREIIISMIAVGFSNAILGSNLPSRASRARDGLTRF